MQNRDSRPTNQVIASLLYLGIAEDTDAKHLNSRQAWAQTDLGSMAVGRNPALAHLQAMLEDEDYED